MSCYTGLEQSPAGSKGQGDFLAGQAKTFQAYLPNGQGSNKVTLLQNHLARSGPWQAKCAESCLPKGRAEIQVFYVEPRIDVVQLENM